ncbi:TonB-dependent receptor [bacterium]|nr:TonB-dependent receptor [bacterium]
MQKYIAIVTMLGMVTWGMPAWAQQKIETTPVAEQTAPPVEEQSAPVAESAVPVEIPAASAEKEMSNFNLDTLVISATRTEHKLGDVPVTTEIITKEDIQARGVKTVQDALRGLPGIKINKSCGSWGDKGKIEIQGLDASQTLILVDGQRAVGGHANAVDLNQIPVEMIERIEIVKGPGSALYGSDAMAGVVNIITKSATEKMQASAGASLGSRQTQIYEAGGCIKTGDFGVAANYTHRQSDGIEKETDKYSEDMVQGTMQYSFTPQVKLAVKPSYSKNKMDYEGRNQEHLGLNMLFDWTPDKYSKLNFRGGLLNYKHYTEDKSTDYIGDDYDAEINYSRTLFDYYTLIGGYSYYSKKLDDQGKEYSADQTLHSGLLQTEMDIGPVTAVLGARGDNHDLWGTETNPKASLMYKVMEGLKLRASAGTAFRAPSLVKLYAEDWRMGPFLVKANPDLKPEKSIGYQVGAEYNLSTLLLTKLSYFRNDIEDLINAEYVRRGRPPWDMNWVNVDAVMTQGMEFSVAGQPLDDLNFRLGYTYLQTEDKETGKELTCKPQHKLDFSASYRIPFIDVLLVAEAEYVGERFEDAENEDQLDAYTLFNLALSRNILDYVDIFVRADNLSGEKNITDEYDIDGTSVLAGLKVKF